MTDAGWLEIGRVVSVDAARRSVRVLPAAGSAHEFGAQRRVWLEMARECPMAALVAECNPSGGHLKIVFTPGVSRDMVAMLGNARVLLPADRRTEAREEPWSLARAVGMRVVLPGGAVLGTVMETVETQAGGALRIRLKETGRVAALPFIDAVIKDVDGLSGVITIADPEPFLVVDDTAPDA